MIRKAFIVVLTLLAVATFTLWIQGHLAGRRVAELRRELHLALVVLTALGQPEDFVHAPSDHALKGQ